MCALIALVGRPNVGKSSLFNRLLGRSQALVDDRPGVTRDRHYSPLVIDDREGLLVDTGGFDFSDLDPLALPVTKQIMAAMEESDLTVLVVDGLYGQNPQDMELANILRRSGRPSMVAVNKIDSPEKEGNLLEFYSLGLEPVLPVSAAHGFGVEDFKNALYQYMTIKAPEEDTDRAGAPPRVAIIGRPNAGKSSLINHLLGSSRLVVDSTPGTTRDAVDVELQREDKRYVLVDTAGVRRRGRIDEKLEKLSVMRALKSLETADVAVLVVDVTEGLAEQDAHIAGYAHERGRPVIILANKWDLVKEKIDFRKEFQKNLDLKMFFLEKAPWITVSAKSGRNLERLFPMIDKIMEEFTFRAPTAEVNRVLEAAMEAHTPPQAGKVRLKFYYGTQASTRPPSFVLFANRPQAVHFSYKRFLVNRLKEAFGLELVPVRLFIRASHDEKPRPWKNNK